MTVRPGRSGALLVVTIGVALVLALLGAVVGGSWELQNRFDLTPPEAQPLPVPPPAATFSPPPLLDEVEPRDPIGLRVLGFVLLAVAVAVVVWRLLLWWWHTPRRAAARLGASVVAEPEPELPVLRRGVAAARRSLDEVADPTDAILAAWLALEEAAAHSGVGRRPAQTPTEFTVAVLAATRADADATGELLALYHRARFSRHPVTRGHVEQAAHCLGRLAAGWDAVDPTVPIAGQGPEPPR